MERKKGSIGKCTSGPVCQCQCPNHLWIALPCPHRLLEVGAVTPDNYRGCAFWIDVTSIDLHSRHPSILEQDFLLMDQSQHREAWDIISLSLVLNFVPDGKDRGTPQSSSPCAVDCSRSQLPLTLTSDDIDVRVEITGRMLVRAHSMIRSGGLCFIAVSPELSSFFRMHCRDPGSIIASTPLCQ